MRIFEDITLTWGDEEFIVKGDDNIMVMFAKIESFITLAELTNGDAPKMTSLANAYAAALNFAGAKASSAEVYQSMFTAGQHGVATAISGLLVMMVPPETLRENMGKAKEEPKKKPVKKKSAIQKKHTK